VIFRNRWGLAKAGATLLVISMITACNLFGPLGSSNQDQSKPIASPTPTLVGGGMPWATQPPNVSRCEGLSGSLEIGVLVGPSDAVGLEPVAIGKIPFSTMKDDNLYIIQGNGPINYDDILVEEWGTFSVKFDMQNSISGLCEGMDGSEQLNMSVEMSGEQMVEVRSEGFQGDYPWTGTHNLDLIFPLEEGASYKSEGLSIVLHLN